MKNERKTRDVLISLFVVVALGGLLELIEGRSALGTVAVSPY